MEKFVVIGSCMSASTAKRPIESSYYLLQSLEYLRIDAFNVFLKDSSAFGTPKTYLDELEGKIAKGDDKSAMKFRQRVAFQTNEKLAKNLDSIKSTEFIFFNNKIS